MSTFPNDGSETLNEANASDVSFLVDILEDSQDIPTFEFSSPISSIGSNCSSPDRDRTVQRYNRLDEMDCDDTGDFVSLDELKSQISPPSEGDCSDICSSARKVELETIFEDCYLETPPGTPTSSRPKKARRVRMNLSSFEEFKENVQNNLKTSENKWLLYFMVFNQKYECKLNQWYIEVYLKVKATDREAAANKIN